MDCDSATSAAPGPDQRGRSDPARFLGSYSLLEPTHNFVERGASVWALTVSVSDAPADDRENAQRRISDHVLPFPSPTATMPLIADRSPSSLTPERATASPCRGT
jgi:hypothetical protein